MSSSDNGTGEICPQVSPAQRKCYTTTPRRDAAKARLRKWKRNRRKWVTQPSFPGWRYLRLLQEGRARPYELGDLRHELREVLSPRAVELLEHVIAVERGFGGHAGGVRLKHETTAQILRCSQRTAQDVVHELVAVGLVEQRPWFRVLSDEERIPKTQQQVLDGVHKHREVEHRYVTTRLAQEVVATCRHARRVVVRDLRDPRFSQVGKNDQPGGNQRSLRDHLKGERARGRPVRSFVASVLRSRTRQRPTAPPATAKVIERLPDGREAHGSPLDAAAVAERLRRERAARGGADEDPLGLGAAWKSFEAHRGGCP